MATAAATIASAAAAAATGPALWVAGAAPSLSGGTTAAATFGCVNDVNVGLSTP